MDWNLVSPNPLPFAHGAKLFVASKSLKPGVK